MFLGSPVKSESSESQKSCEAWSDLIEQDERESKVPYTTAIRYRYSVYSDFRAEITSLWFRIRWFRNKVAPWISNLVGYQSFYFMINYFRFLFDNIIFPMLMGSKISRYELNPAGFGSLIYCPPRSVSVIQDK
jgi:hypothetical protein